MGVRSSCPQRPAASCSRVRLSSSLAGRGGRGWWVGRARGLGAEHGSDAGGRCASGPAAGPPRPRRRRLAPPVAVHAAAAGTAGARTASKARCWCSKLGQACRCTQRAHRTRCDSVSGAPAARRDRTSRASEGGCCAAHSSSSSAAPRAPCGREGRGQCQCTGRRSAPFDACSTAVRARRRRSGFPAHGCVPNERTWQGRLALDCGRRCTIRASREFASSSAASTAPPARQAPAPTCSSVRRSPPGVSSALRARQKAASQAAAAAATCGAPSPPAPARRARAAAAAAAAPSGAVAPGAAAAAAAAAGQASSWRSASRQRAWTAVQAATAASQRS